MDVFRLQSKVIQDYAAYVRSFVKIRDPRINAFVCEALASGALWPNPLVQINPLFAPGPPLEQLIQDGVLHPGCQAIFAIKDPNNAAPKPISLHRHQVDAIACAKAGAHYVLSTGTGSGKSLSYIVPIVDHVLRSGSGRGIQAVIVYPMNALANSQVNELEKFLGATSPAVTFQRYTGQESEDERQSILAAPPDILLTNYVMLELILTRARDQKLLAQAQHIRFLVFDELHTYRGRQGADVALLIRRFREATRAQRLLCVGTSATLASAGAWQDQQAEIARVASSLFGVPVDPQHVIGETLRRRTPPLDPNAPSAQAALRARLQDPSPPTTAAAFLQDPLTAWLESTLGLCPDPATQRLVRCPPQPLSDLASRLSAVTHVDAPTCERALRDLLLAGYQLQSNNQALLAFRLHQLVSKGEAVYLSPEAEESRYITLQPQQYVPQSERRKVLLPAAFCRECGQEYLTVRHGHTDSGAHKLWPRDLSDQATTEEGAPGFLYISADHPWPAQGAPDLINRVPEGWLEPHKSGPRVRADKRDLLPRLTHITPDALDGRGQQPAWWFPAPFRFCLRCGVSYSSRPRSDFGKLSTLGSEGRSTATTILTMTALRQLRADGALPPEARKLLSFTDNRQDASLQAGHFNDFVEVALLRAALYRAVQEAGGGGVLHHDLPARVFNALQLPPQAYARNPHALFSALDDTQAALRGVLSYLIYLDLRRGWRISSPNLEQTGLLVIRYRDLDPICAHAGVWGTRHPALAAASPEVRARICSALLDYMRRELAIDVDALRPDAQERLQQQADQHLIEPWNLAEVERLQRATHVLPRSQRKRTGPKDKAGRDGLRFLSARGGFGMFLRRPGTLPHLSAPLSLSDTEAVIRDLLAALQTVGLLVESLTPPKARKGKASADDDAPPGYQVKASAFLWCVGDGASAFHDPIRVPSAPAGGLTTNPFFQDLYKAPNADLQRLEAREHTAQVPAKVREAREAAFRDASLPLLFCSPTMELGVDIAQLNVVNLRNVPPTPANYAQRSGRAGRSGQPALIVTYCAAGSPHDQYFFKRPALMVSGAVSPPQFDLTNEDLIRAHIHACWLAASGLQLGQAMTDVIDLHLADGDHLPLCASLKDALHCATTRQRTQALALGALGPVIQSMLGDAANPAAWLHQVLQQMPQALERACDRWRDLYRAAQQQRARQDAIVASHATDPDARKAAQRLRAEAEAQITLLTQADKRMLSDFYPYRYLASEGFLPGYNFPRLPLSAYLPGRRRQRDSDDELLTRPRFLALSEFGPHSIIYHEGARFQVDRVILPAHADQGLTRAASQCSRCGYLHPLTDDAFAPDLCERCNHPLPLPLRNLFPMQNVIARRRERINSDEEERMRFGYDLRSGVRFVTRDGVLSQRVAHLVRTPDNTPLATLTYGHAAQLWRMNLGLRRRQNPAQLGFLLDLERGKWLSNDAEGRDPDDLDPDAPTASAPSQTERVIPFVEDYRNCLILTPADPLDLPQMASLQAALTAALQALFHLEDRDLAAEPLPSPQDRRALLIYEAAEGGAGVLRQLVDQPALWPKLTAEMLRRCHYSPQGEDLHHAPAASERCEASCYDCLRSYFNQREHRLLDRALVLDVLSQWANATLRPEATAPNTPHLQDLLAQTESDLERAWLARVQALGLRLPDHAQHLIPDAHTRPDFFYQQGFTAIFIDGPHHDADDRRRKDAQTDAALRDLGFHPLRFHHASQSQWDALFTQHPDIFGHPTASQTASPSPEAPDDADDLAALAHPPGSPWHPIILALRAAGATVELGDELYDPHGALLTNVTLTARRGDGPALHIFDASSEDLSGSKRKAILAACKSQQLNPCVIDPHAPDAPAKALSALDDL